MRDHDPSGLASVPGAAVPAPGPPCQPPACASPWPGPAAGALPGPAPAGRLPALAAGLGPAGAAAAAGTFHPALSLSAAGWLCGGLAAAGLYLLPVLIAWTRQLPGLRMVAVLGVALGWTAIGWLLALLLALRPARAARSSRTAGQQPAARMIEVAAGQGRRPGDAPPLRLGPSADDAR
ncbi:MAG TPA: superinfection immunity protein [Streptosporangiaceae bacterium]|nr:superinfection immunity protein [Streptosporangiaceae bacterium]